MVAPGVPAAPRTIDNAATTVLHTVDTLATQQGGPYIDTVTLYVTNTTGGAIVVTITALGGATLAVSIGANATVQIFDQQPFQAASTSSGTATQILGQAAAGGLRFYGWFARPL
jgi:hypothetical protein